MRLRTAVSLLPMLGAALTLACSDATSPAGPAGPAFSAGGRAAFGFNGIASGFPTGVVRLTGGGSFDPATASNVVPTETSVHSAGGFDCVGRTIAQGPLTGCADGEGVRWDTAQLLKSIMFKCTGADAPKPAVTDAKTAVLLADFYRAGDGNDESFTAQVIVADRDIAPEIPGVQNFWVQGVGCGTAKVHFN